MPLTTRLCSFLAAQSLWLLSVRALPSPHPTPIDIPGIELPDTDLGDINWGDFDIVSGISDALEALKAAGKVYGAPANNFECKSERNPVVMLHGLSANREVDLNMLQKELNGRGYCTFSQTYGAHTFPDFVGGLISMRESAKDIATFIREVKDKTGAEKVDVVGHSEGGVQAIYVPMTQPGIADIVEHVVALGPAIHGAEYFGFTDLWYIGGEPTRKLAKMIMDTLGCPACEDMARDGAIYNDFLNAEKIAQDGNNVTVIMSESDTLVPKDASMIDEEGVNNVVIQDTCPEDPVGHAGLMWDKSVWRLIVNALEENDDEVFACEEGLPL